MNKKEEAFIVCLEKMFACARYEPSQVIGDFHSEMSKGLCGSRSSLKMIPAYVDKASGREKGTYIALDLGGTNFRILKVKLCGKGKILKKKESTFIIPKRYMEGPASSLFDFIAGCIRRFIGITKDKPRKHPKIGFTFSFPVQQTSVASGILVHWTKGFSAKGAVGKDVVWLLKEALIRKGLTSIKIVALANDTVGTLVCRSYKDPFCDIGVIFGTGTNACYQEKTANIPKWKSASQKNRTMIVNIEWGNFNKLKRTPYDVTIDVNSNNPGYQRLEKMVSGMYLGKIVHQILLEAIKRKVLFDRKSSGSLKGIFKTEYLSSIESDTTAYLSGTVQVLRYLGIKNSLLFERQLVKKICGFVSQRASHISALGLAAILTKIDPKLSGKHTIAVDGTLYNKHPAFAARMRKGFINLFDKKSKQIKITPTNDGSGIGAAIIAAVAERRMAGA